MNSLDLATYRLFLIGGSAGSFSLMHQLAAGLPADFPVPVLFVLHRSRSIPVTTDVSTYSTRLKSQEVEDKQSFLPGNLYWAPANYHVLVEEDHFSLDVSEPVWYSRPSIDVTFETAARFLGKSCLALLLSGANQDGAAGLQQIHDAGGFTMVQDPADAAFPVMPTAALNLFQPRLVTAFNKILNLCCHGSF